MPQFAVLQLILEELVPSTQLQESLTFSPPSQPLPAPPAFIATKALDNKSTALALALTSAI
jgi:hypothetical protein